MNIRTVPYLEQVKRWPTVGRHILAQFDEDTVLVYQACRPATFTKEAMRGMFDMPIVTFKKTGREIKDAVKRRKQALQERLDARNKVLDGFMENTRKVRSYLVRSSRRDYDMHSGRGYMLQSRDDVSSEELQDITQLCQRILEIEGEIYRPSMAETHMEDDEVFELTIEDLISHGFDTNAS